MAIHLGALHPRLRAMIRGGQLGNTYYVDVYAGDDHGNGRDPDHALKTLRAALAKVVSYRGDLIVLYSSGTGRTTVDKEAVVTKSGFMIAGPSVLYGMPVPYMANIDMDDGVSLLDITSGSDIVVAGLDIKADDGSSPVPVIDIADNCDRISIVGCRFHGDDTVACVGIDAEAADDLYVGQCEFHSVKSAIAVNGARPVIAGCHIIANQAGAVGVAVQGSATYGRVEGGYFYVQGTGSIKISVATGATGTLICNTMHHESSTDPISDSGTGTAIVWNHKTGVVNFDGTSTSANFGLIKD